MESSTGNCSTGEQIYSFDDRFFKVNPDGFGGIRTFTSDLSLNDFIPEDKFIRLNNLEGT